MSNDISTIALDLKSHLIGIVLALVIAVGSIYGVENLIAKHDAATNAKWQTLLTQQQAQSTKDEASLQDTLKAITAQNDSLSKAITQRDSELASILKADAALTANQAATKLGGTVVDPNTISLPLDTARGITEQLDSLTTVKADLLSETQIATGLQTELTAQTKVVSDLQTQLQVESKACSTQVAAINAKARKSKLKWFVAGVVAGFTLGHIY